MTVQQMVRQVHSYTGIAQNLQLDISEIVSFLDSYYEKAIDRIPGHQLSGLFKRKEANLITGRNYYFEKSVDFPDIIKAGAVQIYSPGLQKYFPADILGYGRGIREQAATTYRDKYTVGSPGAYLGYPTEQTPDGSGLVTQSIIIIPTPMTSTTNGKGILLDYVYDPDQLTIANLGLVPKVPTEVHEYICMGAASEACARLERWDGFKKWRAGWEEGMMDYKAPQFEAPIPDEVSSADPEDEMT